MSETTDQEFVAAVNKAASIKSDQELADLVGVSGPTFRRWCNGRNLPHPMIRPAVVKALSEIGS